MHAVLYLLLLMWCECVVDVVQRGQPECNVALDVLVEK